MLNPCIHQSINKICKIKKKPTKYFQVDGAVWKDNKIVLNLAEFGSPSLIKNVSLTYATKFIHTEKNIVELPLYSNSTRSSFICSLKLPAGAPTDSVSLSGAALIVADI